MHDLFTGLWRHPDFLKLWAGQTVSLFGSLVGRFALPLVGVLTLDVSPFEMGLLRVADLLPAVLVGLFAGAWVDRLRRRPLMIWADLGRALLLATIPAAAVAGVLRVEQLYAVALLVGVLTTFFDVAYQAYLPTLIQRAHVVEGNSKLQASSSVAETASFGIAGVLVQVLTAPVTLLVDALSFLVSAASLALIRAPEPPPTAAAEPQSTLVDIRDGLRHTLGDPVLRALAGAKATHDFFLYMWAAVLLLFLTRDLALEPAVFGVLFAIGGVTGLLGALAAQPVARRWGLGPTLLGGLFLGCAGLLLVPLAAGPWLLIVALVGAQQLFDAPAIVYEIHEASLIQARTPDAVLGRVTASLRCVGWAAMLAGSLAGGLLGEIVGLRATMLVGALGTLPAVLWLVFSPVRTLR